MSPQPPILLQAAHFLKNIDYDQLPIEAVEIAKRAVLDYIGVAIPGSTEAVTQNLIHWAKDRSWGETASIIGSDLKVLSSPIRKLRLVHDLANEHQFRKCFQLITAHLPCTQSVYASCRLTLELT